MSEELAILTQIAQDVGEVKGTVVGIRDQMAAHVSQDTAVQARIFERLGALEVAHASAVGHAVAIKSFAAAAGAVSGAIATLAVKFWPWHH